MLAKSLPPIGLTTVLSLKTETLAVTLEFATAVRSTRMPLPVLFEIVSLVKDRFNVGFKSPGTGRTTFTPSPALVVIVFRKKAKSSELSKSPTGPT